MTWDQEAVRFCNPSNLQISGCSFSFVSACKPVDPVLCSFLSTLVIYYLIKNLPQINLLFYQLKTASIYHPMFLVDLESRNSLTGCSFLGDFYEIAVKSLAEVQSLKSWLGLESPLPSSSTWLAVWQGASVFHIWAYPLCSSWHSSFLMYGPKKVKENEWTREHPTQKM